MLAMVTTVLPSTEELTTAVPVLTLMPSMAAVLFTLLKRIATMPLPAMAPAVRPTPRTVASPARVFFTLREPDSMLPTEPEALVPGL